MQKGFSFRNLVFLDESSINYALTRLYGWGEKSKRAAEGVPDSRFQRLSILSTMRLSGHKVTSVFRGTLCKELFVDYLQSRLAPSLGVGDVLVLDNSSVHRSKLVCEVFSQCGIRVLFLPRYSSDLNPIELMWSKEGCFAKVEGEKLQRPCNGTVFGVE
jgi:hypothetical protein